MAGWVKIHRNIEKWGWYSDPITSRVFLHLVIFANYEPKEFLGHTVNIGSLAVGREKLATSLGLSEQNIRTALNKLKSTKEITIETYGKFSIITVCSWTDYQHDQPDNQPASQPTINQQVNHELTTTKEDKKKERKKKEKAPQLFPEELILPSWVPSDKWKTWLKVRKEKGASNDPDVLRLALSKLSKLRDSGENVEDQIDRAILGAWKSFFGPNEGRNSGHQNVQKSKPKDTPKQVGRMQYANQS